MFLCLSNFAWVGENWAEMVKQRGKTFRTPKLKSRKSSLKPPWYDRGVILSVTGKSVNFDNVLAVVQLICRPRGPKSAEQQSENSQTFASDCILSDVPYRTITSAVSTCWRSLPPCTGPTRAPSPPASSRGTATSASTHG